MFDGALDEEETIFLGLYIPLYRKIHASAHNGLVHAVGAGQTFWAGDPFEE